MYTHTAWVPVPPPQCGHWTSVGWGTASGCVLSSLQLGRELGKKSTPGGTWIYNHSEWYTHHMRTPKGAIIHCNAPWSDQGNLTRYCNTTSMWALKSTMWTSVGWGIASGVSSPSPTRARSTLQLGMLGVGCELGKKSAPAWWGLNSQPQGHESSALTTRLTTLSPANVDKKHANQWLVHEFSKYTSFISSNILPN